MLTYIKKQCFVTISMFYLCMHISGMSNYSYIAFHPKLFSTIPTHRHFERMKLLGWIHKRFGQNGTQPLKHLLIGKEEEQEAWNGIFPGFLAIGTLGLDPSSTPTFSFSVENVITEKEDEVTQNELKLINAELEKVLVLTSTDDDSCGTGGRSSAESNAVCPLQEYLFGSAVELSTATTTVAVSKNKEEQQHGSERTSLAELFLRSKLEDRNNLVGTMDDNTEEENKSGMEKKVKKKRRLYGSSSHILVDWGSAERKVHNKIVQMFQKKIHPENGREAEEKKKKRKNVNKEQWIKTDADYLVLEL